MTGAGVLVTQGHGLIAQVFTEPATHHVKHWGQMVSKEFSQPPSS